MNSLHSSGKPWSFIVSVSRRGKPRKSKFGCGKSDPCIFAIFGIQINYGQGFPGKSWKLTFNHTNSGEKYLLS